MVGTPAAERVKRTVKRNWLIMSGRLVDVGGFRLRIECSGEGGPTVVMDAGLSQTIESWGDALTDATATFTRVCVYDRAGIGESDRSKAGGKRTSSVIVDELSLLLRNAGETGPNVLVGHSFGGINVWLFASRFPADVGGLLLVDPSHENQYMQFASLMTPDDREN